MSGNCGRCVSSKTGCCYYIGQAFGCTGNYRCCVSSKTGCCCDLDRAFTCTAFGFAANFGLLIIAMLAEFPHFINPPTAAQDEGTVKWTDYFNDDTAQYVAMPYVFMAVLCLIGQLVLITTSVGSRVGGVAGLSSTARRCLQIKGVLAIVIAFQNLVFLFGIVVALVGHQKAPTAVWFFIWVVALPLVYISLTAWCGAVFVFAVVEAATDLTPASCAPPPAPVSAPISSASPPAKPTLASAPPA